MNDADEEAGNVEACEVGDIAPVIATERDVAEEEIVNVEICEVSNSVPVVAVVVDEIAVPAEMELSMENSELKRFMSTALMEELGAMDQEIKASGNLTNDVVVDRALSPQMSRKSESSERKFFCAEYPLVDCLPLTNSFNKPEAADASIGVPREKSIDGKNPQVEADERCSGLYEVDSTKEKIASDVKCSSHALTPSTPVPEADEGIDHIEIPSTDAVECALYTPTRALSPMRSARSSIVAIDTDDPPKKAEAVIHSLTPESNGSSPVKAAKFLTPGRQSVEASIELIGNEAAFEWRGDHVRFDVLGHSWVRVIPSQRILMQEEAEQNEATETHRSLPCRLSDSLRDESVIDMVPNQAIEADVKKVPDWCGSHIHFNDETLNGDKDELGVATNEGDKALEPLVGNGDHRDELGSMDASMSQMRVTVSSPKPARYHAWKLKKTLRRSGRARS